MVGIEVDWEDSERVFKSFGLPPHIPAAAWRTAIPLYHPETHQQIGYASSGTWSPLLKKNIALATVNSKYKEIGQNILFELTVEFERNLVNAKVTKTPFFDPERKKS
jgi:aminomethyltransferase